jgi:DNA-binding SARP family transcriptional activator
MHRAHFLIFCSTLMLFFATEVSAQTYGLEFSGMNKSLDNRTELDLSHGGYLTFQNEFEISFDYKATRINPKSNIGLFGYILRIINKDNKNIDLLSSIGPGPLENSLNFSLVIGSLDSIVQADYPPNAVNNWVKLKIKINLNKDQLIFYTPDAFYVQENIGFNRQDDIKIIFGANDFGRFKTSDVPTMSVRDLKISEQGKLKYHWPLDEKESDVAIDRLTGQNAHIKNPTWLNLNHQIWKSRYENEFKGGVMFATNKNKGKLYMIGKKELTIFSTADNISQKHTYKNEVDFLNKEYRSIYNSLENKIYCYLVDGDTFYILDIVNRLWSKGASPRKVVNSNYRHHYRFYNTSDNSIYTFGGYGQHKYNNDIRKIDLTNETYVDMPTNDSIYQPRYLAGLGSLNDTLYLLGGYGSKSGNQLINPQSYYDLIGYSIKDATLFKKFEIPQIIDDMCVANSMWIDETTRDYYALIFEKSTFDGYLRLIKGNLDTPDIDLVGGKIPFQFLDVRSNVGLQYMPNENKLYAFTSYNTDSTTTKTKVYSINYPPNKFVEAIEGEAESKNFAAIILTVFGLVLFGVVIMRLRKKNKETHVVLTKIPEKKNIEGEKTSNIEQKEVLGVEKINYRLISFGGFQVIGKESEDITKHFTPLLKELFLLIWLHTFKNNKGISTEKITEVLWYDKSDKSAQNNRAVNLAKLRGLLNDVGKIELSKKTGYWKCVFDESDIRSDYVDFLNLTSAPEKLTKEKIYRLIEITKKGPFLRNVQYEWLDDFKANVSNITIDTLVHFGNLCDIEKEADFIVHLADSIFIFDVTNEDAMILKCKAQYVIGKHSHAKATYKKFSKEYLEMYGEEYEQTFVSILKSDN